ncbi:MAG: DUF2135 domain-containing protein, partial [Pseudomonadota bacterium]
DPGLIEWTKGNNFRTRVYPLPPKGTRTVRVRYVSELAQSASGLRYLLPVATGKDLEELNLRVEVQGAEGAPSSSWSGPKLSFKKSGSSYLAATTLRKGGVSAQLVVDVPARPGSQVLVEENPEGQVVFCVRSAVSDPRDVAARRAIVPRRMTVLWDVSRSRGTGDHARELEFLQKYLASLPGRVEVELVPFHYATEKAQRFTVERGDSKALLVALREIVYDGGTQLSSMAPPVGQASPDLYLLFSDGLSNIGSELAQGFKAPLYAISVGSGNNTALLDQIARASGGQQFNLDRVAMKDVLGAIGVATFSFLSSEAPAVDVGHVYPRTSTPVQGAFALSGQLRGQRAQLAIRYGVAGKVLREDKVVVERKSAVKGTLLTRFWAQQQLGELLVSPKRNREAMVALGKRFGLVTPATSLIVLESLDQYVTHQIEPPASLPEMRTQYLAQAAQQRSLEEQQKQEKLTRILELWQQRVQWWEAVYKYPKNFRYGEESSKKSLAQPRAAPAMADMAPSSPAPDMESRAMEEAPARLARGEGGEAEGKAKEKKDGDGVAAGPQAAIALAPWQPDTPYLRELQAKPARDRYRAYLSLREKHGSSPAFFLDCADFFYREKQPTVALRVLTNIAEIELEDAPLLRVLAHRLAQLGELRLAAQAFEDVLRLRPEEPQSYRDLALVLGELEDYPRALELLTHVVMNRWDRFDEIEVIALMELNRMIPRAKKKGVTQIPLDPRLIKNLDVDTRIVMTWDADLTDMDLWVIEPSGEKAYYGHNRTTIGGLVSRDFTQGYGPEEYVLKKAMHGEYTVQTNFFGSSAQSMIGAVTLQLDIYTNYGRPNEQKKSVTLRLTDRKETFTVGTVEF